MSDEKNSLSQYLPYAGAGLVFLGVLRNSFFYSFFGINILNFLEVSELITSFIDKITLVLFVIGTILVSILILGKQNSKRIDNAVGTFTGSKKGNDILTKHTKKLYVVAFFLAVGATAFPFYIVYWNYSESSAIGFAVINILILVLFTFLTILSNNLIILKKERRPAIITQYFFIAYLVCYASYYEVTRIKYGHVNCAVYVELDSGPIESSRHYYYVGKTGQHIFFYNDSTQMADIFPMKRVRKIQTDKNTIN